MESKTIRERPRRTAAKIIRTVELRGGFILKCGCVVGASAKALRILMETTSPETVIETAQALCEDHKHRRQVTCDHADV